MFQKKKQKLSHHGSKDMDDSYHPSGNEVAPLKDSKDGSERFKSMYEVYFVGIVPDIVMSHSITRDREAQLVDRIEESQIEGKLPISPQEDDKVKISVSIHGVKVLDMKAQEVLQRHPLHTVAQVVQFSDGGSVNNIAFKIGNVNKSLFSAYVFECLSEEQAQMVCQNVRAMFDKITEKNR
ncbi:integrin beta-1-binding protein 1-like [Mercenaria mercenaria]|uniref:integrin beta-1-binding protein 1-like n=1 Tax=Mercenaria mercenaria TaxID=6596 RepID=UPI00234F9A72|nr:integrin beta-1-binding protein 1-like [Mercenaria mercenaria]